MMQREREREREREKVLGLLLWVLLMNGERRMREGQRKEWQRGLDCRGEDRYLPNPVGACARGRR
jgi:hypothetical protein